MVTESLSRIVFVRNARLPGGADLWTSKCGQWRVAHLRGLTLPWKIYHLLGDSHWHPVASHATKRFAFQVAFGFAALCAAGLCEMEGCARRKPVSFGDPNHVV
jgi:hypothetical protein